MPGDTRSIPGCSTVILLLFKRKKNWIIPDTEESIADVAYHSGFETICHLNHCFKKYNHLPPPAVSATRCCLALFSN